jgi:hypothetical protein
VLFRSLKNLIVALPTTDTELFCKQKYVTYRILEWSQEQYAKNSITFLPKIAQPLKPPLIPAPDVTTEDAHLAAPPPSTLTDPFGTYLTLQSATDTLSGQEELLIAQLAESYIQTEVAKLLS